MPKNTAPFGEDVVVRAFHDELEEEEHQPDDHEDPGTPVERALTAALDENLEQRQEEWHEEEDDPEAHRLAEEYADCDEARYDLAMLYARSAPLMKAIHGAVGEYEWDEGDWREVLDRDRFDEVQARKYREMLDTKALILETIECAGIDRVRRLLHRFDRIFGDLH